MKIPWAGAEELDFCGPFVVIHEISIVTGPVVFSRPGPPSRPAAATTSRYVL